MTSIVDAVEFRRDQYGLTQTQWAYVLRMQPSHYSEFVAGKRELSKRSMGYAFAYGVPAETLFQALPCLGSSDIDRRLASLRKQSAKRSTTPKDPQP